MTYASGWVSLERNVRKKCQPKQIFYSSFFSSFARGHTDRFEIQMCANSRPNEVCNRTDVCVQNVYELCISISWLHICLPIETIWSSIFSHSAHNSSIATVHDELHLCLHMEAILNDRLRNVRYDGVSSSENAKFWIIWKSTNLCIRHS